jgi:hypothetical protein
MLREILKNNITSQASFVEYGYGQVEPNHLSAQRTKQIYAQLPADSSIEVLEQGQFVKYDYMNGVVNFEGPGEWMLVYNEIKLYREGQLDCEFAMIKGNYQARVYSPLDGEAQQEWYGPTRFLQGKREAWNGTTFETLDDEVGPDGKVADYSVASEVADYYEMDDIHSVKEGVRSRLFMKLRDYTEKMMPEGTTMVPRVFKTNVGDIFTTNTINETELEAGALLTPQANDGILATNGAEDADMIWQVVKVYTMPDMQKGAKIMRIK